MPTPLSNPWGVRRRIAPVLSWFPSKTHFNILASPLFFFGPLGARARRKKTASPKATVGLLHCLTVRRHSSVRPSAPTR